MIFKSFRSRIIFWYIVVISATLTTFGLVLYKDFDRRLNRNLTDILLSRADGVVDSIEDFWDTEKSRAAGRGIQLDDLYKLDAEQFTSMARTWASQRAKDPLLFNMVVSIFDRSGREVTSSKNLVKPIPLGGDILKTALQGGSRFDDIEAEMISGRPTPFRSLTFPVMIDNKIYYLVRVMTPLTSLYATMRELRLILFFILPIAIVLSGMAAGFLAGITVRPVNKITSAARLISAENLKTRIAVPESRDEIRALAETFNGMLDRLDRTFTSQREFIENLSHEIKTPLAIIKGEIEVALKRERSVGEYGAVLRSGLEEIDRVVGIVDDLLTQARYDAETLDLENVRLDAAGPVSEAVADFTVIAGRKGITIGLNVPDGLLIVGDGRKLKRIFLNLLDNAVKFTPEGGRIEVGGRADGGQAVIEVADNGPGMSEDQTARIFDRFYRAGTRNEQPGSGLGLSIVKSLVEAHGGRIEVRSAPGLGSVFAVRLPLAPAPRA